MTATVTAPRSAGTPPVTPPAVNLWAKTTSLPTPPGVAPHTLLWAWRTVHRDLTSSRGFRWPWPGQWAVAPDDGRSLAATGDPCPDERHGGLCVAVTFQGAASGGIPVGTVLVCAYLPDDVLGRDVDKVRVRRAWVAEVVDATRANLSGANLRWANLRRANLSGANLSGANLRWANLYGANLRWANLYGANLYEADLYGANLRRANLRGADLRGANYNQLTLWPAGFGVAASGAVLR